ncbi:MAG: helix-turn-helix domain-containing protein [Myxococcales bacterium]
MVQVPKPHVREAFVAAAAQTFAELGFAATTMADVAERAHSSVGNLYKYFANKQQLFDAAVPPELVQELTRRTRARIRALGTAKDVRELEAGARYHALAGDLLDYCLANRAAVVVVLARAEGTDFAQFGADFVEMLGEWALDYARVAYPALKVTRALRFALHHAYRSFVSGVAEALQSFPEEAEARAVISLLTSQHQGGLKRLFETGGEPDAQSLHAGKPSVGATAARARVGNPRATGANSSAAGAGAGKTDRARRAGRRR